MPESLTRPTSGVVLRETGLDPHVIAEEVSRVAELWIGQDMGTRGTATAFLEMETDSFPKRIIGGTLPVFPGKLINGRST